MSNINDLKVNDIIRFSSKAFGDNNIYYGKIISECNYDLAISYGDIFAMYNNIKIADNSIPEIEYCNYFLLKIEPDIDNDNEIESGIIIAFAKEWILESTFNIVNVFMSAEIIVYDIDSSEVPNILSVLISNGYHPKLKRMIQNNI